MAMFEKAHLDNLFGELDKEWRGKPEHEQLTRDAHLGIACQMGEGRCKLALIRGLKP
jgi:hypothetical protein